MGKARKFKFPKHLLNQVDECTNGFLLMTIDQDGEFEVFQSLHSPVDRTAMWGFLKIFGEVMKKNMTMSPKSDRVEDDEDEAN